ncbi:2-succinyl-5-enolpyruvyl-6-hydroxy-3-cyclohexene-1-carboxylic-acid synthase [Eupransor demetentiae]|uniref:2-succinyl-5-enolpyruvyl-6-hydroxy-3-cyclohexene-1-carboxylate synthase n=1 Tax=Eupransor demetentiae TaxID=3109584 RepID=A0ABP0EPY5_9LACO|nr:2-succinyl-5-enolpyruvyl-6-hydroxy-3-cyclohexene-1-carboxylate synthase (MenD) [Lactobacillaceae bacterium LMG 33000]
MTDTLTLNGQHLILALYQQGVRHLVLSPGSRSTPLALLFAEFERQHDDFKLYVDVDERSAAFFALGLIKGTGEPVALLATSGTAILEYTAAVGEASLSHLPLIILSTNRPQELRGLGTPQTLPQQTVFSDYVKEQVEITLQDGEKDVSEYIDFKLQTLVQRAKNHPVGPVQVELPLRKPLMPEMGTTWPAIQPIRFYQGENQAPQPIEIDLKDKKVLILAGPAKGGQTDTDLLAFAQEHDLPILTDVLSRQRGEGAIYGYDALLKAKNIDDSYRPDLVLRFGATPVSGRILNWLKANHCEIWQIGPATYWDHSRQSSTFFDMTDAAFLKAVRFKKAIQQQDFNQKWQALAQIKASNSAAKLVQILDEAVDEETPIFVANSMAVRDFDNYFTGRHSRLVYANRGANGIDGEVSSAMGLAAASGKKTVFFTGDLTFFHDLTGLNLAKRYNLPIDIIVVNNNGGKIFSHLPQAQAVDYFEEVFQTPQDLDFEKIAAAFSYDFHRLAAPEELAELLNEAATKPRIFLLDSQDD